jgi:two-component system cell cycle sensor histidine kinase/response regulator CckA
VPQRAKHPIIILLTFIWCCAFTYLVYFSSAPLQWLSLSVIAFLTIIFIVFLSQSLKQQYYYEQRLRQLQVFSSVAAEFGEVIIFDEMGKTVYTTHPHLYPHQKEFLRKVLARVSSLPETAMFKKWVEEHHTGEIILSGGGDGLGQQKRRWLARVQAIDPTLMRGENYILVTLSDLTPYLEGFHQLKESYGHLERFLDEAPFALLYISKSNHVVGCNQTLSSWLNISKADLMGQKLSDIIDNFEEIAHEKSAQIISVKPKKHSAFKAIYFPQNKKNKRTEAAILCKLNSVLINGNTTSKDIKDEISFIHAKIPSIMLEENGVILSMNPAFNDLIVERKIVEDERQKSINFYDLLDTSIVLETKEKVSEIGKNTDKISLIETLFIGKNHPMMAHVSVLKNPLKPEDGLRFLLQFIDISEQKRLEQQFSQSQKMQAIGQLAGGIAHDFNNLLTAMIGFCDLLLQRYLPNDPSYMDVVQIKQNANRAANLVRQLLAFSRQQSLQPKTVDVTEILSEISALLRRLIGVNIKLNLVHGQKLYPIKADISQFEQIMINMAVNARDAMRGSGVLTIKTRNFSCVQKTQIHHDIMPKGEYVLIEIEDTGCGISPDIIDRIFEPFFSTKEIGQGTGLGLSTVYGIVKQSNGFIEVVSIPNIGSTFKMYFPKSKDEIYVEPIKNEEAPGVLFGGGIILLVEDEEAVRMFSARALREKGYEVLEADNGEDALAIVKSGQKFDLLVTDVVMPKMDGPTLNKNVREFYPHTKTIFISGYTEDTFRKNLGGDVQIHFLAKPFSLKDLIKKVQDVLS